MHRRGQCDAILHDIWAALRDRPSGGSLYFAFPPPLTLPLTATSTPMRDEPAYGFAGGKAVKVDRVEWVYLPDAGTAQAALLSGEINFYLQPQNELLPILEADPNVVVEILDTSGSQGILRMSHLHPPFSTMSRRAQPWSHRVWAGRTALAMLEEANLTKL